MKVMKTMGIILVSVVGTLFILGVIGAIIGPDPAPGSSSSEGDGEMTQKRAILESTVETINSRAPIRGNEITVVTGAEVEGGDTLVMYSTVERDISEMNLDMGIVQEAMRRGALKMYCSQRWETVRIQGISSQAVVRDVDDELVGRIAVSPSDC